MKKALSKVEFKTWHYVDGKRVEGVHDRISGDVTGIIGNVMKDESYEKTNREKARTPTKQKRWCCHCDAALVGDIGKCPVCKKRQAKKVYKQ